MAEIRVSGPVIAQASATYAKKEQAAPEEALTIAVEAVEEAEAAEDTAPEPEEVVEAAAVEEAEASSAEEPVEATVYEEVPSETAADEAQDSTAEETAAPEAKAETLPDSVEPVADEQEVATEQLPATTKHVAGWVARNFPGREFTFLGAVTGLLLSLLVFAIGLQRTLIIAASMTIGALVGQYFDGDHRVADALKSLVGGKDKE